MALAPGQFHAGVGRKPQNTSAAEADSAPTTRKAGGKSAALMASPCFSRTMICTTSAPMATPVDNDSCWAAATNAVARLNSGGSISAYAMVLMLVNCSDRKKPPTAGSRSSPRTACRARNWRKRQETRC